MNRIFSILCLGLLILIGCEKEIEGPYLQYGANPVIFSPVANSSFTLAEDKSKDIFSTVSWSDAGFGFQAQVTYEVQVAFKGTNFSDPMILGTVNRSPLSSVTIGKLNDLLIGREAQPGKAVDLELRVVSKVNSKANLLYSKTVDLKVTPYKAALNYPKLQVPGSYQGWNPADNTTVIYSLRSDDKYEGFIYFNAANTEFKYTVGPKWDVNYGDKGADGILDLNGDNLKAPDAGYYRLRVNLNDLTHSYSPTKWGLIGSATAAGWDADQDMTFNQATGVWTLTAALKAGEIKFRANDAWTINFGDNGANSSLEYDGSNIAIAEAANYEIQLILNTPLYTYKVTKK